MVEISVVEITPSVSIISVEVLDESSKSVDLTITSTESLIEVSAFGVQGTPGSIVNLDLGTFN